MKQLKAVTPKTDLYKCISSLMFWFIYE